MAKEDWGRINVTCGNCGWVGEISIKHGMKLSKIFCPICRKYKLRKNLFGTKKDN